MKNSKEVSKEVKEVYSKFQPTDRMNKNLTSLIEKAKLAEVEGRKIYLQDRLRISLDEAKKAMDMINEIDADIFHMRQDIELQIINN